jgi:hypothetical protein
MKDIKNVPDIYSIIIEGIRNGVAVSALTFYKEAEAEVSKPSTLQFFLVFLMAVGPKADSSHYLVNSFRCMVYFFSEVFFSILTQNLQKVDHYLVLDLR